VSEAQTRRPEYSFDAIMLAGAISGAPSAPSLLLSRDGAPMTCVLYVVQPVRCGMRVSAVGVHLYSCVCLIRVRARLCVVCPEFVFDVGEWDPVRTVLG
jgi:hypothetical protein